MWDELADADLTIHFGVFFWTGDVLAGRVVERLGAGMEVYGVLAAPSAANTSLVGGLIIHAVCRPGAATAADHW